MGVYLMFMFIGSLIFGIYLFGLIDMHMLMYMMERIFDMFESLSMMSIRFLTVMSMMSMCMSRSMSMTMMTYMFSIERCFGDQLSGRVCSLSFIFINNFISQ